MHKGTLIDDLITAVQRVEAEATQVGNAPRPVQPRTTEPRMFMHQMQMAARVHAGVA